MQMTATRVDSLETSDRSIVETASIDGVVEIFSPRVSAMVYGRAMSDELARCARSAPAQLAGPWKTIVAPGPHVRATLGSRLVGCDALVEDIAFWTDLTAEIADVDHVGVRLAPIQHAMCPRFHVDHVALRVVITYVGPGTELVAESGLERRWLAPDLRDHVGAEANLVRDSRAIRRCRAGEVVLMKGERWPGRPRTRPIGWS
jgi:hypothetical protein